MDMLKEWVCNLFVLILTLTFIEILLPDSSIGRYIRFIFSLIIMAAVIYPVVNLING